MQGRWIIRRPGLNSGMTRRSTRKSWPCLPIRLSISASRRACTARGQYIRVNARYPASARRCDPTAGDGPQIVAHIVNERAQSWGPHGSPPPLGGHSRSCDRVLRVGERWQRPPAWRGQYRTSGREQMDREPRSAVRLWRPGRRRTSLATCGTRTLSRSIGSARG